MVIRTHGGIITDQMLTGSLRYFEITEGAASTFVNTYSAGLVATVAIVNAGTGYTAGDDLTVVGGFTEDGAIAATLDVTTVTTGNVTAITVLVAQSYVEIPPNPVSVTGGTGNDDATFDLTYTTDIIIPGAESESTVGPTTFDYLPQEGKVIAGSVAERVLRVIQERANIVQINVLDDDTIQIAVESEGYSWDVTAVGGGANGPSVQTAVQALGTVGLGAINSNDPPVPDTSTTGVVAGVDCSGLTVTEITTFELV